MDEKSPSGFHVPFYQNASRTAQALSKESVRSWSLKTLALIAELNQDQRRRVLEHALKVNRL